MVAEKLDGVRTPPLNSVSLAIPRVSRSRSGFAAARAVVWSWDRLLNGDAASGSHQGAAAGAAATPLGAAVAATAATVATSTARPRRVEETLMTLLLSE